MIPLIIRYGTLAIGILALIFLIIIAIRHHIFKCMVDEMNDPDRDQHEEEHHG